MNDVTIIAVNRNTEGEERLKKYLIAGLRGCVNIIDLDVSKDFTQMIESAITNSDQVILVFDAAEGMNIEFASVCSILYNYKKRPVLIITNSDKEGVDVMYAKGSFASVWLMIDENLAPWEYMIPKFFFSYETGCLDVVPEATTDRFFKLVEMVS